MRLRLVDLSLHLLAVLVTASPVLSASPGLTLTLVTSIDIGELGFASVGGGAFDDVTGSLWICDAASRTNDLVELDPSNWTVRSKLDASIIPDLVLGPDALAIHPGTGNLFAFSTFLESEAGEMAQGGIFVRSFPGSLSAGGAAFDAAGRLFLVDEEDGTIRRVNIVSGLVEEEVFPIDFAGRLSAADFDPISGHLFTYATETKELLEIDITTGEVRSGSDMTPFLVNDTFPTGFAFNTAGDTLYFSHGSGAGGDTLSVIDVGRAIFIDGFETGDLSAWTW